MLKSIIQKKSLKLNVIMNMVLTLSGIIFPLITFPYVTRILQPEGMGKIAFANSIVNYFSMFAALGIPTYGIRACAKVRDNKEELGRTVREIMTVNLIMTVIAYIVLFIAVLTVKRLHEISVLMAVFSLNLVLTFIGVEWLYKALECYAYITARSLVIKAAAVILMFLFVKTKEDYIVYAVILVLANTGYGLFNFINLRKYVKLNIKGRFNYFRHIKPVAVFFAMSVATTVYTNLDTSMLGFMCGDKAVGVYDVAVKIKVILVSIVASFGTVLMPRASYFIENKSYDDFYRVASKALESVLIISVPCTAVFMLEADKCILFLSGSMYAAASVPMRIIMPTLIFIGITNIIGLQILVPIGKEKAVLCSELAGALIDLIINLLLIPKYGAAGAAAGTTAAELSVLFVQFYAGRKEIKEIRNIEPSKIIAAAAAAAAVIMLLRSMINTKLFFELLICFGTYFIVYAAVLYAVNERTFREIVKSSAGRLTCKY